jgi:DNA-binding transcriptional LysR family regulator
MDLRHLELLRELADRGTVTAVATATYRSASAVSQQLHTAERAFGVPLVEPDGRGLRLTAAGRLLARGASDVASLVARLQRDLDALQGAPGGVVSVAGLPSALEFLVPGVTARLAGSGVEVTLTDEDVAEAEFAGRAADHDVVIAHSLSGAPAGSDRLAARVIAREPLDVAVPRGHALAGRVSVTPGERWIGVPEGYPFDTVRIAIDNRASEPLRVVQRLRDNRAVESLVAAGQGCALLPRFTTIPRPGVVLVPLAEVGSVRSIYALGRPDRWERAAVGVVLDALAAAGDEVQSAYATPAAHGRRDMDTVNAR